MCLLGLLEEDTYWWSSQRRCTSTPVWPSQVRGCRRSCCSAACERSLAVSFSKKMHSAATDTLPKAHSHIHSSEAHKTYNDAPYKA